MDRPLTARKIYVYLFLKSIFSDEKKTFPLHSLLVPSSMEHKIQSEAKINELEVPWEEEIDLALLMIVIEIQRKLTSATRQVALNSLYEAPVQVLTDAAGSIE